MREEDIAQLREIALRVREHVIRISAAGGCFIGSALSCVDVIVYLYARFLDVDKERLSDPNRDYFLLSKGHAVPALYGTLVELGLLERDRLENHLKSCDSIYWHPNQSIPGVEFHSGSLGHGLSVATGVAMDCRLRGQDNKIVVITGDGELNEGSNWEAFLVASSYRLDNLIVVVDRNGFQANARTEELTPLEPLGWKFRAFGWQVVRVDGHRFRDLEDVFPNIPFIPGKPSVVIAETVRGRGLPSIENRADRWFCDHSHAEAAQLLKELHHR